MESVGPSAPCHPSGCVPACAAFQRNWARERILNKPLDVNRPVPAKSLGFRRRLDGTENTPRASRLPPPSCGRSGSNEDKWASVAPMSACPPVVGGPRPPMPCISFAVRAISHFVVVRPHGNGPHSCYKLLALLTICSSSSSEDQKRRDVYRATQHDTQRLGSPSQCRLESPPPPPCIYQQISSTRSHP